MTTTDISTNQPYILTDDYDGYDQMIHHDFNELNFTDSDTKKKVTGHININFVPHRNTLKLSSFVNYLRSFSGQSLTQANITNTIFGACIDALNPKKLELTTRFEDENGFHNTYKIHYPHQ